MKNLPKKISSQKGFFKPLIAGLVVGIAGIIVFVVLNRPVTQPPSLDTRVPIASPTPIPEIMEEKPRELIEGMPDIPLYPDAVIEKSTKRTIGTDLKYTAHLNVVATPGEIISFYQTELTNNGWTITHVLPNSQQTGEGAIEATKNNTDLHIDLDRHRSDEPTDFVINVFVKNN